MNSDPEYDIDVPDDASEADVLEQHLASSDEDETTDERTGGSGDVPAEADPADVGEQRRPVGGQDDDEYR